MSQRQFLSTLIWLVLVNLIIKAIFIFGIDLQVQKEVGQASYGQYFALLNLCYIFQIINDFGLHLLHGTDTARHGYVRKGHWTTILRLKFFLSVAYVVIVLSVAGLLGIIFSWQVMIALAISTILVSWISVLRAGISGMARYKTEAAISVLDKALMILICGFFLLYFSTIRIEWFAWAQVAAFSITLIIALIISRRVSKPMETENEENASSVVITFKDAIPFCLATMLMYLYTRADGILLTRLLPDGPTQAGIYAAGFRLLDAANMVAILVTPLLIPMYARLHHNRAETSGLLHLAAGIMICMTMTVSLIGFWWYIPIMRVCYGHDDNQWVLTFRWLIVCHIPIGLMYVYGSYLTALRQLKQQNILYVFMVLFNLGLNFYFIPRMTTIGAAMVAVLTQSITTCVLIIMAYSYLGVGPQIKWVMKVTGYVIVVVVSGWVMSRFISAWWLGMFLFALWSLVAAVICQLIAWKKIKELTMIRFRT